MVEDGRVLVVRKIDVQYQLRGVDPDQREAAERAHGSHAQYCPVARSISGCVEITTSLEFV